MRDVDFFPVGEGAVHKRGGGEFVRHGEEDGDFAGAGVFGE